MKSGTKNLVYRGVTIAIRWVELESHMPEHRRFVANYEVDGLGSTATTRDADKSVFVSSETATEAAIDRAQIAIDTTMAAGPDSHGR